MTSKLEDVARALFADQYPETAWDSIEEMEREDYRGHARAALMATKNPTYKMIEAHMEECAGDADEAGPEKIKDAFNAMIDAALEER